MVNARGVKWTYSLSFVNKFFRRRRRPIQLPKSNRANIGRGVQELVRGHMLMKLVLVAQLFGLAAGNVAFVCSVTKKSTTLPSVSIVLGVASIQPRLYQSAGAAIARANITLFDQASGAYNSQSIQTCSIPNTTDGGLPGDNIRNAISGTNGAFGANPCYVPSTTSANMYTALADPTSTPSHITCFKSQAAPLVATHTGAFDNPYEATITEFSDEAWNAYDRVTMHYVGFATFTFPPTSTILSNKYKISVHNVPTSPQGEFTECRDISNAGDPCKVSTIRTGVSDTRTWFNLPLQIARDLVPDCDLTQIPQVPFGIIDSDLCQNQFDGAICPVLCTAPSGTCTSPACTDTVHPTGALVCKGGVNGVSGSWLFVGVPPGSSMCPNPNPSPPPPKLPPLPPPPPSPPPPSPSPPPPTPPKPPPPKPDDPTLTIIVIVAPTVVVLAMCCLTYGAYKWKQKYDAEQLRKSDDASGIYLVADFIFSKVDKDKSGTVEPDEMREFLCGPGGMSAEEVEALIVRMDTDKSGTIDKEEWRMAWVGGLASQIQKMRAHEVTQAQKATGRTSMRQFTGREEDGDAKNNVPAEGSQDV